MIRAFDPDRDMEMAVYAKSADGTWTHEAGAERAFGLCTTTIQSNSYEHWWLMASGLIHPENMSPDRKVVIKALDDAAYGDAGSSSSISEWVAQQRINWLRLESQEPGRALEWIRSNAWSFESKPPLTTLPPFPGNPPTKRQIDDGSMGVFLGLDDETATHLGELFVSGSGNTRSEIWVFADAYQNHIPPGTAVNDPQHWITLGPTRTFASQPANGPQDFIDRAWSGFANPGGAVLVSAAISAEIR